ncbi:MAG: hypothetical protein M1832_004575 [Thelocarpon impressellum]|nr:MAG: hypothetical protein M1832_004575 [Thelocarpon impressellum]
MQRQHAARLQLGQDRSGRSRSPSTQVFQHAGALVMHRTVCLLLPPASGGCGAAVSPGRGLDLGSGCGAQTSRPGRTASAGTVGGVVERRPMAASRRRGTGRRAAARKPAEEGEAGQLSRSAHRSLQAAQLVQPDARRPACAVWHRRSNTPPPHAVRPSRQATDPSQPASALIAANAAKAAASIDLAGGAAADAC